MLAILSFWVTCPGTTIHIVDLLISFNKVSSHSCIDFRGPELVQVDQLFRKRLWFDINISSFKGKTWGPFLESPQTFRAHFGGHNSLCVFKTKASRDAKFCSYLIFIPFTTKKPALLNKWIGVWRMAFRARKFFGTFEKWALRRIVASMVSANLALRGIQNLEVAMIYITVFSADLLRRTRLWDKFMDFVINTVPRHSPRERGGDGSWERHCPEKALLLSLCMFNVLAVQGSYRIFDRLDAVDIFSLLVVRYACIFFGILIFLNKELAFKVLSFVIDITL